MSVYEEKVEGYPGMWEHSTSGSYQEQRELVKVVVSVRLRNHGTVLSN